MAGEKVIDKTVLIEKMSELKSLLQEDDFEALTAAGELLDFVKSSKIATEVEQLCSKVSSYDFDEAIELLNQLENTMQQVL
jgi:hypothetical protein